MTYGEIIWHKQVHRFPTDKNAYKAAFAFDKFWKLKFAFNECKYWPASLVLVSTYASEKSLWNSSALNVFCTNSKILFPRTFPVKIVLSRTFRVLDVISQLFSTTVLTLQKYDITNYTVKTTRLPHMASTNWRQGAIIVSCFAAYCWQRIHTMWILHSVQSRDCGYS